MKRLIASLLAVALVVFLALSAVALLAAASMRISGISNVALRFLATAGVFGAGVAWLLGTVYLGTRMAVQLFGKSEPPRT